MMLLMLVCSAIAVIAEGAPIGNAEQTFLQAAAKNIHEAQQPLLKMQQLETQETAEMADVEHFAKDAERYLTSANSVQVLQDLANAQKNEEIAGQQEDKQQALALESLNNVKSVIGSFSLAGIQKQLDLGETGPFDEATKAALATLREVKSTLERGTATSNTENKIKQMVKKTTAVADEIVMNSAPVLGETALDRAPTLAQAAAALAASHQETDSQARPMAADPVDPPEMATTEPVDHAEMAATDQKQPKLQSVEMQAAKTEMQTVKTEMQAIEKLEREVVHSEQADLQEIKGLAKKLN